jgi:hypothetical protein
LTGNGEAYSSEGEMGGANSISFSGARPGRISLRFDGLARTGGAADDAASDDRHDDRESLSDVAPVWDGSIGAAPSRGRRDPPLATITEASTRDERRRFEEDGAISDRRLARRRIAGHTDGGLLKTRKAIPFFGGRMSATSSPAFERRKIS